MVVVNIVTSLTADNESTKLEEILINGCYNEALFSSMKILFGSDHNSYHYWLQLFSAILHKLH